MATPTETASLRALRLLTLASAFVCSCIIAAPADAGISESRSGYERCDDVIIRNSDGSVYTRTHGLFVKNVGCHKGRRVARKYLVDDGAGPKNPLGFSCSGGSDGVACRKGRKHVTWGYYFDRPSSKAGATARRGCGRFHKRGYTIEVDIERGAVGCKRSRQVARSFFFHRSKWDKHGGPGLAQTTWSRHGWSCGLGAGGGGCLRDRDRSLFYYQVVGIPRAGRFNSVRRSYVALRIPDKTVRAGSKIKVTVIGAHALACRVVISDPEGLDPSLKTRWSFISSFDIPIPAGAHPGVRRVIGKCGREVAGHKATKDIRILQPRHSQSRET